MKILEAIERLQQLLDCEYEIRVSSETTVKVKIQPVKE